MTTPSQDQTNALLNLYNSGRMTEAERACRKLLHIYPQSIIVLNILGAVLERQGRLQEVVQVLDKVIQLKPDHARAYYNRGTALQKLGQLEEAIRSHNMAIQLKPDYAEAYSNRGTALQELGQLEEAIRNHNMAIQLKPDYAEAYSNRGAVLQELGQLEEAVMSCNRAIQLKPVYTEAYYNRGAALQELGQLEEAVMNYNRAIQLQPDYAEAHWNLSVILLLQGNFKDGWREYEWRSRTKDFRSYSRNFMQPQWDGSSLDGKTILLSAEQGAGDSIQFIRYIKQVAKYNVKIIVECQKSLVRLFSTLPEIDVLISEGETIPAFDVHAPLLSLPCIFGTTINTVPVGIPYLFDVDNEHISLPQPGSTKLRVGIVWAGSPGHTNDRNRSTSLTNFLPLASIPDIQLFSLQLGDHRNDLGNIVNDSSIIDLSESIHDYVDTARIISQLDLVISVDTSVAHLAGAMGKPTWVILPFVPDFRWLLDRDSSPWYPTMRLFRQIIRGDWTYVFSKVKTELNKYSGLHECT